MTHIEQYNPRKICILIMVLILTLPLSAGGRAEAESDIASMSFEQLEEKARGTEVGFYMWGGSTQINGWVDSVIGGYLQENHDITLRRVPMDASVFVNRLLSEKDAGRDSDVMDILWINGENFKNAREGRYSLWSLHPVTAQF